MSNSPRVLFCNCAYTDVIGAGRRRRIFEGLAGARVRLVAVPDLCEAAAERDPRITGCFDGQPLTVVACYPRAVKWLARFAGCDFDASVVRVLNMRTDNAESILAALPHAAGAKPLAPLPDVDAGGDWVPWYPALDMDRCVNCKQCLSFCPFGVYGLRDDDRVTVTDPRKCKNNCPACARICPEAAIIFPKAPDPPINGAPVTPQNLAGRGVDTLKRKLAGNKNLHELLAARRLRAACMPAAGPAAEEDGPDGRH